MQLKPPVSHTKGIIMNKLIYPLAGALMLGATLPVLAGPDFRGLLVFSAISDGTKS